jgi:hypothetical protein
MAASKKDGGKNRKFGRHSRNPSSVNQPKRTERNRAKRAAKSHALKINTSHVCPPHNDPKRSKEGRQRWDFVQWRGVRVRFECL